MLTVIRMCIIMSHGKLGSIHTNQAVTVNLLNHCQLMKLAFLREFAYSTCVCGVVVLLTAE